MTRLTWTFSTLNLAQGVPVISALRYWNLRWYKFSKVTTVCQWSVAYEHRNVVRCIQPGTPTSQPRPPPKFHVFSPLKKFNAEERSTSKVWVSVGWIEHTTVFIGHRRLLSLSLRSSNFQADTTGTRRSSPSFKPYNVLELSNPWSSCMNFYSGLFNSRFLHILNRFGFDYSPPIHSPWKNRSLGPNVSSNSTTVLNVL